MAAEWKTRGNRPKKFHKPIFKNENNELKNVRAAVHQLEETIQRLKTKNEELEEKNEVLCNEVKRLNLLLQQDKKKKKNANKENGSIGNIREYEDQISRPNEQLKQEKERASEVSKVELAEKQQKDSTECKDVAVIPQQILQKQEYEDQISKLNAQLNQEKESYAIQNQRMLDSMKQFKTMLQVQAQSVSTMKTEILTINDELNKQCEELKSETAKLVKQIDQEKDCHSRRLDELRKEFVNKKELFEEHFTKLERDITVRMNGYCTKVQSTNSMLVYAVGILKKINARKLEDEEESYKFTNAFTSAGEGSVLEISKRYRHLQHNMRASAVRASKQVYKVPAKSFFCQQTMNAYEAAKTVLLEESGKCINMHLIKLQASGEGFNEKLLNACMRIVDYVANDEVTKNAIQRITQELQLRDAEERTDATKNDSVEPDVSKYYHTLAELTWQAISRPIPMVYGMEEQVYKKDFHDIKDGGSDDEGTQIVYVYPVLYSSNQWPRQVAQIGRVELKD